MTDVKNNIVFVIIFVSVDDLHCTSHEILIRSVLLKISYNL